MEYSKLCLILGFFVPMATTSIIKIYNKNRDCGNDCHDNFDREMITWTVLLSISSVVICYTTSNESVNYIHNAHNNTSNLPEETQTQYSDDDISVVIENEQKKPERKISEDSYNEEVYFYV